MIFVFAGVFGSPFRHHLRIGPRPAGRRPTGDDAKVEADRGGPPSVEPERRSLWFRLTAMRFHRVGACSRGSSVWVAARVVSIGEVSQASAKMADCIKHLLGICRRSVSGRRLPQTGGLLHAVPAACQKFILTHGTASQKAGSRPMGVSQFVVGSYQRQSPRSRVLGKTPSCSCVRATGASNQNGRGPGVWHHGSRRRAFPRESQRRRSLVGHGPRGLSYASGGPGRVLV